MSAVITGDQTSTTGLINSKTAVASTSGTSIDFTGIPAGTKRIMVMFNGVSTNGTSNKGVRIGAGSVETSGYDSVANWYNGSGGAVSTATVTSMFLLPGGAAADVFTGTMTLLNISGSVWIATITGYFSSGGYFGTTGGGSKTITGTLDRIRITTVNGTDTFDAGSINILYE